MSERCHTCDRPKATSAQYDAHVQGCECTECIATCWGGAQCEAASVDWCARALAADGYLAAEYDLRREAERGRDSARAVVERLSSYQGAEDRILELESALRGDARLTVARADLAEARLAECSQALDCSEGLRREAEAEAAGMRECLGRCFKTAHLVCDQASESAIRAAAESADRGLTAFTGPAGRDLLAALRQAAEALSNLRSMAAPHASDDGVWPVALAEVDAALAALRGWV